MTFNNEIVTSKVDFCKYFFLTIDHEKDIAIKFFLVKNLPSLDNPRK